MFITKFKFWAAIIVVRKHYIEKQKCLFEIHILRYVDSDHACVE